jgi:hypothetical protein
MLKALKNKRLLCIYLAVVVLFIFVQVSLVSVSKRDESGLQATSSYNKLNKFSIRFDPNRHTLVLFHIQKTSGTNFDLELVVNLQVRFKSGYDKKLFDWRRACETRSRFFKNKKTNRLTVNRTYECYREDSYVSWILSWHSAFGWQCGLHPGLSDLRECINKKAYKNADLEASDQDFHYISLLREPRSRFLSEWMHVQKHNSTWIYEIEPLSKDQICLKSTNYSILSQNFLAYI